MSKRRIAIVTGTRAEYGLLYWLMQGLQQDPDFDLQIIVTGAHLSPVHGLTYRDIEHDGFRIDWKVDMLLASGTASGVTRSLGLATIGFAEALEHLPPEQLVEDILTKEKRIIEIMDEIKKVLTGAGR